MTKIKICGLKRDCDIDFVNEALPDYAGFVFAKSKRQVTKEQAKRLKERLDLRITAVGVFVDAPVEFVAELANENIIDMIQLHGNEDEEYVIKLRQLTKAPVIKAFKAGTKTEEEMKQYPSDYDLIDSGKGSGKTFDWNLVPKTTKPWFLAGGISEDNVEEAIHCLHPYGVDFSSSVETDGYKDRDKILRIVRRIRNVKR